MLLRPEDFAKMVTASPYGVLVHDAVTKEILWANPTTIRMLEFTFDELLPLKAHDMSGREDSYRRAMGLQWLQHAADHGVASTEWMYRSKSGREILTEAIATRLELEERAVLMVQFRDIEREEQTRRTLTRTQAMLTAFLDRIQEGILLLEDDATIAFASESSEALLGMSNVSLVGMSFLELCEHDSRERLRAALVLSRRRGRAQPLRFEVVRPGTEPAWYSGSCQYVDDGDDLRGNLVLFHDVTEPMLSDLRREREAQHLNYLARFTAMGDMATTIEHEIAQPLAAAMNFLAGTQRRLETGGADPRTLEEGIEGAMAQLNRANVIMRSLRGYVTRLEQAVQRVDLNELVAEAGQLLNLRADDRGVRLELNLSPVAVPIWCERVLTVQVVLNLCYNAIDEMAEWPTEQRVVRIETDMAGGVGRFRVLDTGKGLGHVPDGRIFDGAFTSKSDGHGIGLALSHQVIQRQEGRLRAWENLPHGAVFEFALPLADQPASGARA